MPHPISTREQALEGFWSRVNRDGPVMRPELGPCWVWTRYTEAHGYGAISWRPSHVFFAEFGRVHMLAHRVAYILTYGPIDDEVCVLHQCDNPPCVRPDHLWLGTRADNSADMARKKRYRMPNLKGEQHPRAKLTRDQVDQIRQLFAEGKMTKTEIGHLFGVHRSNVRLIITGQHWG